ncbi:DUF1801 domain-containing protein [Thalassotalea marina]|uniref:YdhG-like domain-containing protein n=1 Tax=Thalassotalea marina TaxID=1673741 RepID=A0A919EP92_9GAMM|nr:DUF1801 domain-containing protein [Thalassotalea marina]GHG07644.1 hypothetical protein GCM10017161_41680 [Thalassotalea marina]
MSTLKTRPHDGDVQSFLASIENDVRREDAFTLLSLFSKVTQEPAVMWGDSIVGFGEYRYTNSKGEFSWLLTGFSPRKQNLTLYIMQGFDNYQQQLAKLGKVKTAKSCLYISRLDKIDLVALEDMLMTTVADMRAKYS